LDRAEQTRYRDSRHGRSEHDRAGGQSWLHPVGQLGRGTSGRETEGGRAGVSALRRQTRLFFGLFNRRRYRAGPTQAVAFQDNAVFAFVKSKKRRIGLSWLLRPILRLL